MNLLYDFAKNPASWDFLQWLINVEIWRYAHQGGEVGIAFKAGPREGFRNDTSPRPASQCRMIFDNVMRPALQLTGAKELNEPTAIRDVNVPYLTCLASQWDKHGGQMPMFKVPQKQWEEAGDYLGERWPLTITLREASYHPRRNSNIEAWKEFAQKCGEDVIFIRDTAKADEPLEGFETCPRASKDLLFRAALMAHARCNLTVSNGPWILCLYSRAPWLNFNSWRPDYPEYSPGQESWWASQIGCPVGSQFPWASPYQRMVWKRDDYESIKEAWEQMPASSRRRRRRQINKEWQACFDEIRAQTVKYGDAMLRIDTIEMFEDTGDDKPADLVCCCDLLEHLAEPMLAVDKMNRLATKTLMFCIKPDAIRTEEWWRKKLETAVTVTNWFSKDGMVTCFAQAGMKLQGVTMVGAMSKEDRWSHLEYSIARFPKRIPGIQPPHDKPVALVCYGPSLGDHIPKIRELQEAGATVVSVSGSHDFLIKEGVVPDFHVECDPRPHKTTNLKNPDKRVKYLIASSCDPSYFDKLAGQDVSLWHVSEGSVNQWLVDELKESVNTIVSGGGSVGLRSLPLLYHLGYRDFEIFAMDCSLSDDDKMWAGPHAGKIQEVDTCDCGGRVFKTTAALMAYATQFFDVVKRLPDAKFQVWGDGLLAGMCRLYWANPQIKQQEERQNAA